MAGLVCQALLRVAGSVWGPMLSRACEEDQICAVTALRWGLRKPTQCPSSVSAGNGPPGPQCLLQKGPTLSLALPHTQHVKIKLTKPSY